MPCTGLRQLKVRFEWEIYMRTTFAALTILAAVMLGSPVNAQTVSDTPSLLIAVRHADTLTEPGDRALSDAGISRAKALAVAVRNAGVTAIITSQFRRSRDTAQPTASVLGLTPEVIQISRAAIDNHLKQLEAAVRKHKGGVVLVVGHEETVTQLIAALGGPRLAVICPSHHANLFSLTMAVGKAHLVHSRYGEPDVAVNDFGLECL
jgi:phosphohistidine phosphatase SixA